MSIINKLISCVFRSTFALYIITDYIYFILFLWYPISKLYYSPLIVIFFYNFLTLMLVWTIIMTAFTEPGKVPLYWGFYLGDKDDKRRRYCLMCNVFKPDRCHHCSMCNKCILNMDHHCPWINNCVGFYNRKFFIQMLFYLIMWLVFSDCVNLHSFISTTLKMYHSRLNLKQEIMNSVVFLLYYIVKLTLTILITIFFKFHLNILFENKTTIETIDKKTVDYTSQYNYGKVNNWRQVMGKNVLLWFFPINLHIGMPIGNGIDWSIKEDTQKLNNISLSTDNVLNNNSQIKDNNQSLNKISNFTNEKDVINDLSNKHISANENLFESIVSPKKKVMIDEKA